MAKSVFDPDRTCLVEFLPCALDQQDIRTEIRNIVKGIKSTQNLTEADVVVAVGFGLNQDPSKGLALAQNLTDALGGVLGATRASVDAGWIDAAHMIGQTGKTVRPKLYIALGISGAIQHNAGIQDSDCIIAVNKDETAPIFGIADYGICGDLFRVVPLMIEAIADIRKGEEN